MAAQQHSMRNVTSPKTSPTSKPRQLLHLRFELIIPLQDMVGIIMGSTSDWPTMEHAAKTLADLGVPYENRVVSAHRTPDLLCSYAKEAESRGLKCIIAGAGGAAHLPGMTASMTTLPVLGVPVESRVLKGVDSLLSIVQMPAGIPVATFAIGKAGATNAALAAASIIALEDRDVAARLKQFRDAQTEKVHASQDDLPDAPLQG